MYRYAFLLFLLLCTSLAAAQTAAADASAVVSISAEMLAGENLTFRPQKDSTRTVYQDLVYDGEDIAVFIVAIGTGITNEFSGFPLEEFIYWINGKAWVEPDKAAPFAVHAGDYFIQAKGFNGKWNFVENGGLHLELALIAKNRPDSTVTSPISRAMVIDRDIISGVNAQAQYALYRGAEIDVNVIRQVTQVTAQQRERLLHVLAGVLTAKDKAGNVQHYYPGDFLVVPAGNQNEWSSNSLQQLRLLEVYKADY
ncbi:MAG: cupin domain-containing protein [Bacteroidota bacterium]